MKSSTLFHIATGLLALGIAAAPAVSEPLRTWAAEQRSIQAETPQDIQPEEQDSPVQPETLNSPVETVSPEPDTGDEEPSGGGSETEPEADTSPAPLLDISLDKYIGQVMARFVKTNETEDMALSDDGADGAEEDGTADIAETEAVPKTAPFADVPVDAEGADAIRYVSDHGILGEWGGGLFHPDALLTRGQAISFLRRLDTALWDISSRMESSPEGIGRADSLPAETDTDSSMVKVETDSLLVASGGAADRGYTLVTPGAASGASDYSIAISGEAASDTDWAVAVGILGQSADGNYDLDSLITRAQLAAFLYRYAEFAGADTSSTDTLPYRPDRGSVPNYAVKPYCWAVEHHIYTTFTEDSLLPRVAVSRRQAALIAAAFLADATGEPEAAAITDAAQKTWLVSASRTNHDALEKAVTDAAHRYGASGVQVAVIEGGHVTDAFACGWAVKDSEGMTADYKLRIASLSKVTLAMTAMALKEEGYIDLDSPIGKWWGTTIQNPYYPDRPITLRTLLTHTSSISSGDATLTASAVRSRLGSGKGFRDVIPGSLYGWAYNNYGFGVLGLTLELARGQVIDKTMWEEFYRAMDMDASFYGGDLRDTSKIAALYYHGGGVARTAAWQRDQHAKGVGGNGYVFAGGLMISARDLGKLVAVLANDGNYEGLQILEADSVAAMESHGDMTVDTGFWQGLAIRSRTDAYGRRNLCYHTGSAYGVYTGLSYDPDTGDGVVVLTVGAVGTRDENGSYAICGDIYDAVYHAIAK